MTAAISKMASQASDAFPATIYYAFKQSEVVAEGISSTGWATFLQAIMDAGYSIVGTWPVRTERDTGLKVGMNVLANSVVLVCRKKDVTAETITRAEFLRRLKRELPPAIAELQSANVSPADMPQSAIGPGMGVFSRYSAVLEADDAPMSVKTALQLINAQLDEFLNDLHGDLDPDTRFDHLTVWEACQYLIRALENDGEYAAAELLKQLGGDKAEMVKDLAYYLFDVCSNKRQDAKEAMAYNGLIAVWPELTRQAATITLTDKNRQARMDL